MFAGFTSAIILLFADNSTNDAFAVPPHRSKDMSGFRGVLIRYIIPLGAIDYTVNMTVYFASAKNLVPLVWLPK